LQRNGYFLLPLPALAQVFPKSGKLIGAIACMLLNWVSGRRKLVLVREAKTAQGTEMRATQSVATAHFG
jgi:hypothetical protein